MDKKQYIVVLLCVVSSFLLLGCRDNGESGQSPNNAQDSQDSSTEVQSGSNIDSIYVGMSEGDILSILGEPEKVTDNGMSWMYLSKGFTLMVFKGAVGSVNCYTKVAMPPFVSGKDFQGSTAEGIGMGANRSQIISAYGEPDNETTNGRQTTLNYGELEIDLILMDDKLVQFFLRSPKIELLPEN